jgi:hypothetical protein
MRHHRYVGRTVDVPRLWVIVAVLMLGQTFAGAQSDAPPNPYHVMTNFFKLPDGRALGSTAAIDYRTSMGAVHRASVHAHDFH